MTKIFMTALFSLGFVFSAAHASETVDGAKRDIDVFKKEMIVKLEQVEKQIEVLHKKAKVKGGEIQEKTASELEDKRAKLQVELDSLSQDTKSNWQVLKKNLAESIDSLHAKVQKALKD